MPKLPYFQFYPGDWLKDANLRRCSSNARAVWIDMLCIMFECEERGVLGTDGVPWTEEEIARAIPGDTYQNILALQELLRCNVARKNRANFVYSKRMVEDAEVRKEWVKRQKNHRDSKQSSHAFVTPMSRPSSSSLSSSLKTLEPKVKSFPPAHPAGDSGEFEIFWDAYPKKLGKQDARKAYGKAGCEGRLGEVLAAVDAWKSIDQWSDPRFIPYPATWLNKSLWKENPKEEPNARTAATPGTSRAERRVTTADEQSQRVFGRSSGLVGGLRPDLQGRPNGTSSCGVQGNAGAIEAGSPTPILPDSATRVAPIPANAGKDLRNS